VNDNTRNLATYIGFYIIKYRKKKKLTQGSLAKLVKVSTPEICHYETGKRIPLLINLKALVQILEMPVEVLEEIFYD